MKEKNQATTPTRYFIFDEEYIDTLVGHLMELLNESIGERIHQEGIDPQVSKINQLVALGTLYHSGMKELHNQPQIQEEIAHQVNDMQAYSLEHNEKITLPGYCLVLTDPDVNH